MKHFQSNYVPHMKVIEHFCWIQEYFQEEKKHHIVKTNSLFDLFIYIYSMYEI